MSPALYVGRLRHRRFTPRSHAFTYQLFMAMIDVDHVDAQMAVSRLTAVNRFAWASFDDRDHLGDPALPLRTRVAADAARHGLRLPDGPIYLLTHLRYLGYNFNPISLYFCCDADAVPALVMGEVHSTFGEQCTYWIPADGSTFRVRTPKVMHVSPFMDMAVDYTFAITAAGESIVAHMQTLAHGGDERPFFDATLTLARRPWTPAHLRRVLARHPWMTGKVIAAIHWEALKLWLKGVPSFAHPNAAAGRKRRRREAEV